MVPHQRLPEEYLRQQVKFVKATKGEADRLVGFAFFLVCSSARSSLTCSAVRARFGRRYTSCVLT